MSIMATQIGLGIFFLSCSFFHFGGDDKGGQWVGLTSEYDQGAVGQVGLATGQKTW